MIANVLGISSLLLSPLAVFFSDVVELVGVVLTLLFYLTPVFYPKEIVAGQSIYWVIRFNPIRSILEIFRDPIYLSKIPPMTHFGVAVLVALALFVVGSITFKRSSARIPFYV